MQRVLRLRGDQERRRFFVGVAVDASCTTTTAAIVAASGRGLEARFELASHVVESVPREVTALFDRLSGRGDDASNERTRSIRPTDAAVLAAELAEVQAEAIIRLAAIESDAWPRVLLAGVTDPGLWRSDVGPPDYLGLCDAARLAELTQLNIVDAIPARDVAQGGRGEPLDAVPLWLLLHDPRANRLLWQTSPSPRAVYLPASRDESGASQVQLFKLKNESDLWPWLSSVLESTEENARSDTSQRRRPKLSIDELLFFAKSSPPADRLNITVLDETMLGVAAEGIPAACAALLAMLHIDQVPGNIPMLTGAAAPRVLGRLTPGNAHCWNRLLRDLAFARPLITPLRAAV